MDTKSITGPGSTSKAEFWTKQIRKQKQSGLSKAVYCRKHGLSKYAFYYWAKKLGDEPKLENAVVPLGIINPSSSFVIPAHIHPHY